MSAIKKTLEYLGFVEEDEAPVERRDREVVERSVDETPEPEPVKDQAPAPVTPIHPTPIRPVDTPAPGIPMNRIKTIHPRSYNDAMVIGSAFRDGTPVIMNLSEMDESNSKRLVDFSAGLIFGLHGSIERVTNKVFLLTPENIEVSGESEADPDTQASFFNQS
ncbi:cell division inhibitor SepF [Brevibacterium sanguinis]|uniref:Cell division protein SepF n=2 Tax=Brevibacterium TaxID=1696 RepID=A0A366IGM3_9MICO|nr:MULTISPECIES: cell division protein SepF [Brevibacterium]RBP64028.1 cell division inhibitor SepF [Brevibacterium sanguinis]RBP70697.1 cell division inhibitor SepF [Brevibacterium celere]